MDIPPKKRKSFSCIRIRSAARNGRSSYTTYLYLEWANLSPMALSLNANLSITD